jgi:acyl-homoserine lactone acylase PvdQ
MMCNPNERFKIPEIVKVPFPDDLITKLENYLGNNQEVWIWKEIIKDLKEYKYLPQEEKISSLEILLYGTSNPNFEATYYEKRQGGSGSFWEESDDYLKHLESEYKKYILAEAENSCNFEKK